MAKSSITKIREERRTAELKRIFDFLIEQGEDVGYHASNKINYPIVHENGEEDWIEITLSIPVGAAKRTEVYDGYERREAYEMRIKEKAEKAEKTKKAKAEKAERDRIRRENEKKIKEKKKEKGE